MNWRRIVNALPPILLVVDVIIRVLAVVTVPRNRRPTSSMAWLLAIFVAPIPGSLLFAILGSAKLPSDRRAKQREINDHIIGVTAEFDEIEPAVSSPPWFDSVVHLNRSLGSMPLIGGNSVELLTDYRESIASMTRAVAEARQYVHVEFYIFVRDDTTAAFFDALKDAVDRDISVRVLYDHWATIRAPRGRATRRWLRENGIPFEEMLPFHPFRGMWRRPDLRNHRKIVIVDGEVAFTGSQNMVDASYNKPGNIRRGLHWKDLMVRVHGPAALGLNALFVTDWYSETDALPIFDTEVMPPRTGPDAFECQVVPSGPGFDGENNLRLFNALVYNAQEVAFTGSQNMVDASYNKPGNIRRGLHWKDLMVRVHGPAALGLNALFVTDWYSETDALPIFDTEVMPPRTGPDAFECQVVPSGPGFDGENNLRLFNALVYNAQERLIIASPYFVPDDSMLYAITTAAERGVEVQLFACEVADQFLVYHAQRSYYETLLRAGVRIFLYEKPTVLHSKHFTVDDSVAVIGSSNMDMRSFSLNFEVSLMVRGDRFVEKLRVIEADYRSKSHEVTLDAWLTRSPAIQVLDNVARLTAAVQ